MKTDEIVNRLREYARHCDGVHACWNDTTLEAAAALIESMQAQLVDYHHMSRLVDGKMSENQRLRRINERLQAQLAELQTDYDILDAANTALHGAFEESQRRERAAVEDLEWLAETTTDSLRCNICKYNPSDMGCELDGSQFDDDGECHFTYCRRGAERSE